MKAIKLAFLLTIINLTATAQQYLGQFLTAPKTYWKSFGYQKQPNHIKRAYYKSDSLGYEPTKTEVISFNKEGFIIQEYEQVLGKAIKEKARNYVKKTVIEKTGRTIESCYMYDGEELFAEFTITKKQRIYFYDAARRVTYEIDGEGIQNPFEYALELRTSYQKNKNALAQKFDNSTAKIIFDIPAEIKNEQGDWIRRLQLDKSYSSTERRLVFNQIMYADGTKSGSTDYDIIFGQRVEKLK